MAWFEDSRSKIYFEEEGDGEPVLLLPGWGGNIDEFAFLRAPLAARFRVIAADVPGSGKSGPQPREYTPSYYQDDARSLLALIDHLGVAPAHLVGHSDGGEYALLMAAMRPSAVRKVATWGAGGQLPNSPELTDWFYNAVDDPTPWFKEFSEYLKSTYGEAGARLMTQSAAKAFRAIMDAGGDISRSRATDIECPVLLIVGEHDELVPQPLAAEMAGAIRQAELVVVPGAGHSVQHSDPDRLAETIVNWLSGN